MALSKVLGTSLYPGRAATYLVAANDASPEVKAQADYLCDGTADDVQLQASLTAATALTGRQKVLWLGTFVCSAAITAVDNVDVELNGEIKVVSNSNINAVNFSGITDSYWSGSGIIRRQGIPTGNVFAGYFDGATDNTCRIGSGIKFINEVTGAVLYHHGIYMEDCSPNGFFWGKGADATGAGAAGISIYGGAPTGTFRGYGGNGGANCFGIRFAGNASAAKGEFWGEGGTGGATCHGINIMLNCVPKGKFTGIGGSGGASCYGIMIGSTASPQGQFFGTGGSGNYTDCCGIAIQGVGGSCLPQGTFYGKGGAGTTGNAYGIAIWGLAAPHGDFEGHGGDNAVSNHGMAIWDYATPTGNFTAIGGDGGATCYGAYIEDCTRVEGNFTGIGGRGGANCVGIYIDDAAAPVIKCIGVGGKKTSHTFNYVLGTPPNDNGRFQPYADQPYQLVSMFVRVSVATAGRTLKLGTNPAGAEIATGIDLTVTGDKFFSITRPEIAAAGYMYATPIGGAVADESFSVGYVVISNNLTCQGLRLDTNGYAVIEGTFTSNGASDAVYIDTDSVTNLNWKIQNSHLETLDPTNQYAVNAQAAITSGAQLRNNTYRGKWAQVTPTVPDLDIVAPSSLDLSGAATDITVFHATATMDLVGYTILYTEASSADAGVSIRIGRYQSGVALDDDFFDITTSEASKALGYSTSIALSNLTNIEIVAGDSITVGTAGGKVGTGEVRVVLHLVYL